MKRIISIVLSLALLVAITNLQSCNRKSGCQYETKPKTNRKGELKGKRGKTKLFPKKMGWIDETEEDSAQGLVSIEKNG